MARPIRKTLSPSKDRDGICQSQDPEGAGALTINGALASSGTVTFTTPQHVGVYAAGNESAFTFTVTGTDRYGATITEDIAGPNNGTTVGTKNFATVTAVSVDDDCGAIEVGVGGTCEGEWTVLDFRNSVDFNVGIGCDLNGAMTYSLEHTFDDPYASGFGDTATAFTHSTISGETADADGNYISPVTCIRAKITAFTSGTLTVNILQVGA